jgi:hypothetical protein
MTINAIPTLAQARQPRGIVRINDQPVPGWVSWSVENNAFYGADTFRVTFAASALDGAHSPFWASVQTSMYVEIFAGFPANSLSFTEAELVSLVYGRVDDVDYDPVRTEVVLSGRDLSAAFIDTKTVTGVYKNQRSSDIASALAASHGLAAQVTPTSTPVGTYWNSEQVRLTDQRTEWDLLSYLAFEERFICYVKGKTLYFGPSPFQQATPPDSYRLVWAPPNAVKGSPDANLISLNCTRSLTVAKGVVVTAFSVQTKKKGAVVTSSYPRNLQGTKPGQSNPFGGIQSYRFKMPPNKTQLEVERYAESRYADIIRHEMRIDAVLPGDVLLDITKLVTLEGTRTAWDQTYYPDMIVRRMDLEEGFSMDVKARNHAPDTAPAV